MCILTPSTLSVTITAQVPELAKTPVNTHVRVACGVGGPVKEEII